jgi:UDP-MurNAc hydroxylase
MIVTALGHAGLKVETSTATVLLDPWFSPEGTFQGSWFQFPDNSHLLDASLTRPTAIAISHEHLDHVDPWFLARVPSHVPVIVPRYPSSALRDKISLGGPRRIIELEQWESLTIAPGTRIFFVLEPPMNHDAAMVLVGDGDSLVNLNDARLFPTQLREIRRRVGGSVDVLTFQGAGASWYPMCYRYPESRARELSRRKRLAKFAYCRRTMGIIEPVVGIPFAGPPALLDPDLFHHNMEMVDGIFPDQGQVAEWLGTNGMGNTTVLLPGDSWSTGSRVKRPDAVWRSFSFDDRWDYLREYQARRAAQVEAVRNRYPIPDSSLRIPFEAYFRELLQLSPYFNRKIGMRVGFDIIGPGGGEWHVDFRPDRPTIGDGLEECGYVYTFESRWLPSLLDGTTPWEDFFLSLRFSARRDPDRYNDHLLGLLKFADRDSLEAVERFETTPGPDERIAIHADGRVYFVSRYCPHAGNDLLETGEVLPGGVLRCLAHHYEFDLATGRCLTGSCDPLQVETAADTRPARASRSLDTPCPPE